MNYFVLLDNGQRFGPANVMLLNQWAAEGRLGPNTMLEEEGTMRRLPASQLPGLTVQMAPGWNHQPGYIPPGGWNQQQTPQPFQGYPHGPQPGLDDGKQELTTSLVCSGLSVVLCATCALIAIPLPIVGLVFASKAAAKGHPNANAAKGFAIAMIVLVLLATFGSVMLRGM